MFLMIGYILAIIGISYCTEAIFPIHQKLGMNLKKEQQKDYFTYCTKSYFVLSVCFLFTGMLQQSGIPVTWKNIVFLIVVSMLVVSSVLCKAVFSRNQ